MKHYLLFASHSYAFSILRPLQTAIRRRGDRAVWFLEYTCPDLLEPDEERLYTLRQVRQFNPLAVIACGNWAYPFFPGIKVEVFHGYPMRKRIEAIDDHFTIRDYWDIYCTQGPSSTPYFQQLAAKHRYFRIYETGWCKMDEWYGRTTQAETPRPRPAILYAPTFTRGISSAWVMPDVIERLATEKPWDWIITFHPKLTDAALLRRYEALAAAHPNIDFRRLNEGFRTFSQSDVLLCDSSSLIVEYLMTGKPAVTYRNTHPGPFLLDVQQTEDIGPAIERALTHPADLMQAIEEYTAQHEAHRDGHNSDRVLDAIDDFSDHYRGHLHHKPLNINRRLRMWKHYIRTRLHTPVKRND